MASRPPFGPLVWWESWGIALAIAASLAFGVLVLKRSAYLTERRTDAGIYFRGAWAVRTGADLYTITDDRLQTYMYPPTLAALLAPLADPPPGAERGSALPYPMSVALWYLAGLMFMAVAAHWLALAVEASSEDPEVRDMPAGCRRWWQHRLLPVLFCVLALGSTLSRGQANTLVLVSLAGMTLCAARGQGFRAGVWLAGAASLKIFPLYLLLYPLLRRDWRWFLGCTVGLAFLLLAVPAAVAGPARALDYNRQFLDQVLLPHIGLGDHQSKVTELQKSTDNQSFMAVIHNTFNLEAARVEWVKTPSLAAKVAHAALVALLTVATVLARRPCRSPAGRADVLFLGLLTCVMIAGAPVCRLHYFLLAMPLVAALLATGLERSRTRDMRAWMWGLVALYCAANLIPRLPGFEVTRYLGVAMYAGLALWAFGLVVLWRYTRGTLPEPPVPLGR